MKKNNLKLKKMMACVLAVVMSFSFTACGAVAISLPETCQLNVGEKLAVSVEITSGTEKITEEDMEKAGKTLAFAWAVADETIATVGEDGVLCGVSEGETVLTVSAENGSLKATSKVVVLPAVVAENPHGEEVPAIEPDGSADETPAPEESTAPVATPEPVAEATPVVEAQKHEEKPAPTPVSTPVPTPQPVCGVCGSASHTNHPTCAVCGSTSHTNHPTCAVCGSTSHTSHPTCPTCGSTDHTSHPVPTCEICGSSSHTQHPALNNDQIIEHQPQTGTNEASDGNAVFED